MKSSYLPGNSIALALYSLLLKAMRAHLYGVIFTLFTARYALLGGMKSIVWVDMPHYLIMTIVCISVAAQLCVDFPGAGYLPVPVGWTDLFSAKILASTGINAYLPLPPNCVRTVFSPFSLLFALMAAKGDPPQALPGRLPIMICRKYYRPDRHGKRKST